MTKMIFKIKFTDEGGPPLLSNRPHSTGVWVTPVLIPFRCGVRERVRVCRRRFQWIFTRTDGRLLRPDDGPLDEREQHAGPSINARSCCAQRTPVRCGGLRRQHRYSCDGVSVRSRQWIPPSRLLFGCNNRKRWALHILMVFLLHVLCVFAGLSTIEAYNAKTDEWFHVLPMSTRRSSVGVGVVNGEYSSQIYSLHLEIDQRLDKITETQTQ